MSSTTYAVMVGCCLILLVILAIAAHRRAKAGKHFSVRIGVMGVVSVACTIWAHTRMGLARWDESRFSGVVTAVIQTNNHNILMYTIREPQGTAMKVWDSYHTMTGVAVGSVLSKSAWQRAPVAVK
jgi:hypothetical protein